jgi:hypothetical protein
MSSSSACPLVDPTIVFAKTTPDCVEKPYSTPRCDEYPIGDASCPTIDGTISKPWESGGSQYPPN